MKQFLKQPALYLAMSIVGSSGVLNFRNREATQAQSNTTKTGQNSSN